MAISDEFISYLNELFADLPAHKIRKMFGGVGIFHRGLMIAVGTRNEEVALKADEETIPAFEAEGAKEWCITSKSGESTPMGYWFLPERLLDDPEEFLRWVNAAFEVAMRADAKKSPRQRKLEVL